MEPTPNPSPKVRRTFYIVAGVMIFLGLGMIGGGALAWIDEHSGSAGTAHIYRCYHHTIRYGGLDCYARWTYNDHTVTGYVENAKASQLGKDVSVRIHAHHVTETTYVVPIGLWVGGLFVVVTFVLVTRSARRRWEAAEAVTPEAPPTGSAAV